MNPLYDKNELQELERIADDLSMIADDFLQSLAAKFGDRHLQRATEVIHGVAGLIHQVRDGSWESWRAADGRLSPSDLKPGDWVRDSPDGGPALVLSAEPWEEYEELPGFTNVKLLYFLDDSTGLPLKEPVIDSPTLGEADYVYRSAPFISERSEREAAAARRRLRGDSESDNGKEAA